MGETNSNSGPTHYETLFGGSSVSVELLDNGGVKPAEVFVRQIPVKDFPAAFAAYGDELRLAELYCAQPRGWAETLTPASFTRIITEGERVNADFFAYCSRRQSREMDLARRMPAELVAAALRHTQSALGNSSPGSRPAQG